jgi:hypothetical protein
MNKKIYFIFILIFSGAHLNAQLKTLPKRLALLNILKAKPKNN